MPIDFPTSPTTGQVYTYLGKSWVYNGTAWDAPKALSEIGAVQTFANAAARTAAIPTPTEGIVSYLVDTNALELYNNGWNVINPSSGNAIINGAFDIWQRGTSFSTVSPGYTADRWAIFINGSGGTSSVSRQIFSPGAAPELGYEGSFFLRYQMSAARTGATFNVLKQPVEDVRTFAGQTVTLSFWAKAASTLNVPFEIAQDFGSGGSSTVVVTGITNVSLTTSWQRFTRTFAVPSLIGKTIGTNSSFQIGFVLPIASIFTFDIWGVQLEAGAVATPFKRNAPSIQAELAACQRYFLAVSPTFSYIGYAYSTTNQIFTIPFPVEMRIPPNGISGSALSTFTVFNSSNSANTPLSFSGNVANKSSLSIVVASPGSSIGTPCRFEANSGSAFLHILGAEL